MTRVNQCREELPPICLGERLVLTDENVLVSPGPS